MLEEKIRISKFKVTLRSLILTRNSLVREFVRSRLKLQDELEKIDAAKWFSVSEGMDESAAGICAFSAACYNTITNEILKPLVDVKKTKETPGFKIPTAPIFTSEDEFLEYMDDSLQEVIVFIREHFKHLNKLDKIELPGSGKLTGKGWLLFLVENDKHARKKILDLRRQYKKISS